MYIYEKIIKKFNLIPTAKIIFLFNYIFRGKYKNAKNYARHKTNLPPLFALYALPFGHCT